jgi:hypothetical protein
MAEDPGRNGGPRWIQPLLLSFVVPAVMAAVTVVSMASRFEQRLEVLEKMAEARWAGLNLRLEARDERERTAGLVMERNDQRLDELEARVVVRGRELAQQGQDFSRLLGEILTKFSDTQERLARLEAITSQARGR